MKRDCECDVCGEVKVCNREEKFGGIMYICKDCKNKEIKDERCK